MREKRRMLTVASTQWLAEAPTLTLSERAQALRPLSPQPPRGEVAARGEAASGL